MTPSCRASGEWVGRLQAVPGPTQDQASPLHRPVLICFCLWRTEERVLAPLGLKLPSHHGSLGCDPGRPVALGSLSEEGWAWGAQRGGRVPSASLQRQHLPTWPRSRLGFLNLDLRPHGPSIPTWGDSQARAAWGSGGGGRCQPVPRPPLSLASLTRASRPCVVRGPEDGGAPAPSPYHDDVPVVDNRELEQGHCGGRGRGI